MKKKFPTIHVKVPRNLTRLTAMELAWKKAKKKGMTDFRGFTYNPKTGEATLT